MAPFASLALLVGFSPCFCESLSSSYLATCSNVDLDVDVLNLSLMSMIIGLGPCQGTTGWLGLGTS